ncbi:MAG: cytochrome d ubiquinol oxidase subunit II [Bacteroidetes bacterium]|uniref:Cytochrome d ubiquinol oxidase subunit II n=1 Tax=Candidatus Cryptobacteroides excrementipullorum TaxID=2840761 RepID=A0A9D9IVA2_9BACT|nr:cytochrome d ubiquinol oxidase subunit II [Candidatus Cryptobacteroides excrementipullorum]
MFEYVFLQQYWWFIVSLLGGLLVFLLFVQGGNVLIFSAGRSEAERSLIVNSTGRKWELTFTTLVTFGGAFFASFPLFYSTSFGGAYWLWVLILISFVFQAVSYEFQTKAGNILGRNTFRAFLVANGFLGPFLLGMAVATFFTGSDFTVNKEAVGDSLAPVISIWGNGWHGLEAFTNIWNICLGLAVFFLAMTLGALYMINNIEDENIVLKLRLRLWLSSFCFLILFVAFLLHICIAPGFAVDQDGTVFMEKSKYLHNFIQMPAVLVIFLAGVVLVLYGIVRTLASRKYRRGIWSTGLGTVLAVLGLFLVAGYNGTAYYPSVTDLQSSLTISNSSSSLFTLKTMTIVSFIIPFVLAYIIYAWRSMDRKSLTVDELDETTDKY